MREEELAFLRAVDTSYSYELARRMEQFKTNPVLGYRTAGSGAEYRTGELLRREMEQIGLQNVKKDRISVDSWEFERAVLRCPGKENSVRECQLGAYQTEFSTDGFQPFSLIYLGKGTAADYADRDVRGKLVLVEINQRDEWWINYPVYQAYRRGAAALIAVQEGGYGEIHDTALNAQDIAGPPEAPAFSMSREDALPLIAGLKPGEEVPVEFSACSHVDRGRETFNITGTIPGETSEEMILLSAHYDSYFSGFQDDNAAVAMMLGIARALLESGFRPRKTLVFCAMAAEEWGIADSKYDWSVGAYRQVFEAHPEWRGRVTADLNFELPAHAHERVDAVRTVYEYQDFIAGFLKDVTVPGEVYPEGIEVRSPIETWSDDFSMAIGGIPSLVNEFTSGPFMENYYHSQFDNDEVYQEPVYRFHHELYGRLVLAFDRTALPPLNFARVFEALRNRLDVEYSRNTSAKGEDLEARVRLAEQIGGTLYDWICGVNESYGKLLDQGREAEAAGLLEGLFEKRRLLLDIFQQEQDTFVRLNWHDEVLFPQEAVRTNLKHVQAALECLERRDVRGALEAVYGIDNNRYAFQFDEEVFTHFTDYVLNQPPERLLWGAGRIVHHENLFGLVKRLREKLREADPDIEDERRILKLVEKNQRICYCDDIDYMIHNIDKIIKTMKMTEETESD